MSWKSAQTRASSGLAPMALHGVLGELRDDERVVVGAGGLELHAAQQRVVVVGELEQRDVGRALEERLRARAAAPTTATPVSRPVARPARHLASTGSRAGVWSAMPMSSGERGDREAARAGGADDAAALAGVAAAEDGDERGEEGEHEQVEPVAVDDAGEDRDEQRHEDGRAGVDQDGDDERRERGRRDVGERRGPRAVAQEELQAAERVDRRGRARG